MRRIAEVAAAAALLGALAVGASPAGSARAHARLASYRGLATWVDLYDPAAWRDPEATVARMEARGVRTLFLETGNYRQHVRIRYRPLVGRFVRAAHGVGIRIVAWYLPSFVHPRRDYIRSLAAIRFRTPDRQRFDSFALDIESSLVRSVPLRTARLLRISSRLRRAAGRSYPLGAIIPSPRGMELLPHYWPDFPYAALATMYDVFLPMSYFSYRPRDLGGAFGYTVRNVRTIREESGRPRVPVHPIGGLAASLNRKQVRAFVRAARTCGVLGASLYDFTSTKASAWQRVARVPRRARPARSPCL